MLTRLRYMLSGHLIALALWVYPRNCSRDLLCDYLDEWARKRFHELGVDASGFNLTKRFR